MKNLKRFAKFILIPILTGLIVGFVIIYKTNNEQYRILIRQATYCYSAQDYQTAHQLYQKAYAIQPKNKQAIEGIRACEILLGMPNSDIYQLEWQSFHSFWVQKKLHFFYEAISTFQEGRAYVAYRGKYGYVNAEGFVVIPIIYDNVWHFNEGFAQVKKKDKWGFIDRQGKLIIPFIYENAKGFKDGKAAVKKDGQWVFIDRDGLDL